MFNVRKKEGNLIFFGIRTYELEYRSHFEKSFILYS